MGVLLLNATYEPLCVIGIQRAVCLVVGGQAEIVTPGDRELRSPTVTVPEPRVVRLLRMVKVPFRRHVPLTRAALRARDNGECQVSGCGRAGTTIDHVIPRSRFRGNAHVWENVVMMCEPHNHQKGDKLLKDLGWTLKQTPKAPVGTLILSDRKTTDWAAWLAPA